AVVVELDAVRAALEQRRRSRRGPRLVQAPDVRDLAEALYALPHLDLVEVVAREERLDIRDVTVDVELLRAPCRPDRRRCAGRGRRGAGGGGTAPSRAARRPARRCRHRRRAPASRCGALPRARIRAPWRTS